MVVADCGDVLLVVVCDVCRARYFDTGGESGACFQRGRRVSIRCDKMASGIDAFKEASPRGVLLSGLRPSFNAESHA